MNIQQYIAELDGQTNQIGDLLKGFGPKELTYVPEGKWGILAILEHILITERVVLGLIARPSEELSEYAELHGTEKMKRLMIDLRQRRVKAPETLAPKGRIKTCEEFEQEFREYRNTLKEDLLTAKIVVDNRIHKHPIIGAMTISDWLSFLVFHTQRHAEQIKDLVVQIRSLH